MLDIRRTVSPGGGRKGVDGGLRKKNITGRGHRGKLFFIVFIYVPGVKQMAFPTGVLSVFSYGFAQVQRVSSSFFRDLSLYISPSRVNRHL